MSTISEEKYANLNVKPEGFPQFSPIDWESVETCRFKMGTQPKKGKVGKFKVNSWFFKKKILIIMPIQNRKW